LSSIFCERKCLFSFYLEDDTPYKVELISEKVSEISCIAYFRDESQEILELSELIELDCVQAKNEGNQLKFALENTENDTFIELEYRSTTTVFQGNLTELKQFWGLVMLE